jgi:general secretion pathway protein D
LRTFVSLLLAAALALPAGALAGEAGRQYRQGRKAEREGRFADAYQHYLRAQLEKPRKRKFAEAARRLGVAAMTFSAPQTEADGYAPDRDPPAIPLSRADEIAARLDRLKTPVWLAPKDVAGDFLFTGSAREAYEALAETYGLEAIFDEEYQGDVRIRVEMQDVSFEEAILALNDAALAFVVPLSRRRFLVASDNQNKRRDLEPVISVNVPLPGSMSPETANEILQAVKQTLEINRMFLAAGGSYVVVRDVPTRVRMAQALLERLLHARGEVVVEAELFAVTRNRLVELGLALPASFPITNFSSFWTAIPPERGDQPMIGIGGGRSVFGVAVANSRFVATLQQSDSSAVQRFHIRASDGLEADLRIGERYPIINATFQAPIFTDEIQDGIQDGTLRQAFPSFTFEDLGLIFTVTPRIHDNHEVTLEFQAEFKALAGAFVNDIPIIAARSFTSQIRLRDGESAIVGGVTVADVFRLRSGIAGLAEIPILGRLFRRQSKQADNAELILAITPRIVRLPASQVAEELVFRFGPEQRPVSSF